MASWMLPLQAQTPRQRSKKEQNVGGPSGMAVSATTDGATDAAAAAADPPTPE